MTFYAQKLFHAFLKTPPEYAPPPSPKGALPELDDLKPTLSSVELHRHGNELAVAVEGSNLWFSYQISLHDTQKISIPGEESNGTSIQYNIHGDQEDKIEVDSGEVKVFLQFIKSCQTTCSSPQKGDIHNLLWDYFYVCITVLFICPT